MARRVDPLFKDIPVAAANSGLPTLEFIRNWANLLANVTELTEAQANILQLETDVAGAVADILALEAIDIIAGDGLSGGGNLGAGLDITLASSLSVADEGTPIANPVTAFNFTGSGVAATADSTGAVTVTVNAGGALETLDEGTPIADPTLSYDFVGSGVTATSDSAGNVTVTIAGGSIETQDEGTPIADPTTSMNFVGAGVVATADSTGAVTITISTPGDPYYNPPSASSFATSVVAGGTTSETEFTDVSGLGLSFVGSLNNSGSNTLRLKTAPATPFTMKARFVAGMPTDTSAFSGLVLRDSSSTRAVLLVYGRPSNTTPQEFRVYHITGSTINANPYLNRDMAMYSHLYLSIAVDGSGNITMEWSPDGRTYYSVYSTTVATFLSTLDQIGFVNFSITGGTSTVGMTISYYAEA